MRLGKTSIATNEKFASFLNERYGMTNITPFCTENSKRPDINKFFSAQDKTGKKIFIKASKDSHLVQPEYWANKQLYAIDSEHFTEAIAYHTKSPYAFSATAWAEGIALGELMTRPEYNEELQKVVLENIYAIFLTLKKSDVVHRDIHANQMIYCDGKLKLIDFQYAVSKSNYKETKFTRFFNLIDHDIFTYKKYAWDDTNDLLRVFESVGCPAGFEARYEQMQKEMQDYVGKGSVHYKFPSKMTIKRTQLAFAIEAKLARKGSRKKEAYMRRVDRCRRLLQELEAKAKES